MMIFVRLVLFTHTYIGKNSAAVFLVTKFIIIIIIPKFIQDRSSVVWIHDMYTFKNTYTRIQAKKNKIIQGFKNRR